MKKELNSKRILSSRLFLFLGVIVLGFLIFSFGKKFFESREIDDQIREAGDEIARLEVKDEELGNFLDFLNTDDFLEQEARLKFNLQKPGESVVIIPGSGRGGENNKNKKDASSENQSEGNPKKWWNYFFKS
ncbi:septum formation initiator family protein [Patescibacteria group bacterium]|nr:septum formation initiator family protein [Patescibacteria group bacterium]